MSSPDKTSKKLTVLQVLPALESGGVERGTVELGQYLTQQGHRSLVMSAGGRMVSQLVQAGTTHITLPVGKKSLLTFALIPRLIRTLSTEKVDVLHVRSRMPAWVCKFALFLMPKSRRPVLVTTVHGQYSVSRYSAVMTKSDAVIVISEHIKAYVLANYPQAAMPLYLNYRGVDPEQFPYQYQPSEAWLASWYQTYPALQSKFVITLPARVTRWKGHEDLCHLIADLKQTIPEVHALVVGEVKQDKQAFLSELEGLIQTLDIAEHVTFTGHRADVREIMASSDVVVSLSH